MIGGRRGEEDTKHREREKRQKNDYVMYLCIWKAHTHTSL